ncbi:amidase [Patulibacter defluvii]|uniref:amidase n=1 Tax=Patulibacter defluvii TaxID=3095358 RepID=UPI002A760805|nr:amidase [Patulibacter sp. DM4]
MLSDRDAEPAGAAPHAELAGATLADLGARLAAGALSSRELVDGYLDRIRALDDLGAYAVVDDERAREQAERLDRERRRDGPRGPLHGLPVAIKDNVEVAGLPLVAGSAALAASGWRAPADAPAVARLRAAGAIVLGTTRMHELAFGATTTGGPLATVRNPHDRERIAGGSSGGSAVAVAAGLCAAALGTDTGGSIRVPAALCGVAGLKPTFGAVATAGVLPLARALDTVGPIAAAVADLEPLLETLAARSFRPPPARAWRVAVAAPRGDEHPAVVAAVERTAAALRAAGATVRRVAPVATEEAAAAELALVTVDAHAALVAELARQGGPPIDEAIGLLGADVAPYYAAQQAGGGVTAEAYAAALTAGRAAARRAFAAALAGVDALLTPTVPMPAVPRAEDGWTTLGGAPVATVAALLRETVAVNVAGLPAVTVPAGADERGLPVAVQLIGRRGADRRLLALAATVAG